MQLLKERIFEKFIGIDWSGARYSKDLRVAVCEPGKLVSKVEGKHWRRDELVDWIVETEDEVDAIISAAALRDLSFRPEV